MSDSLKDDLEGNGADEVSLNGFSVVLKVGGNGVRSKTWVWPRGLAPDASPEGLDEGEEGGWVIGERSGSSVVRRGVGQVVRVSGVAEVGRTSARRGKDDFKIAGEAGRAVMGVKRAEHRGVMDGGNIVAGVQLAVTGVEGVNVSD